MKITSAFRSSVLSLAHKLVKSGLDFATAQRKAWMVLKLKAQMKDNVAVSFSYVKESTGEVRPAVGTLHENAVPATKGAGKEKAATLVTYYDVTAAGWRSFHAKNICIAA